MMPRKSDSWVDDCERCGKHREGRSQLMFYSLFGRFPESPVARQFFCHECIARMRIYAIVGFSLLGILLIALAGVTIWLSLSVNSLVI